MLWVVLLGFLTSSLLSILANHNQASKIWLDRLKKNPIHSVKIIRAERLTSTTTSQRKKKPRRKWTVLFYKLGSPQAVQLMTIFKWVF